MPATRYTVIPVVAHTNTCLCHTAASGKVSMQIEEFYLDGWTLRRDLNCPLFHVSLLRTSNDSNTEPFRLVILRTNLPTRPAMAK